jgi:hypothetical protein
MLAVNRCEPLTAEFTFFREREERALMPGFVIQEVVECRGLFGREKGGKQVTALMVAGIGAAGDDGF